ncbi:MAG: enoyl-CoA hydratase/isomerase family protein [Hyphomicrobiaceae bacterium]|nr:enoyl-CoA hydratase/isomerase family protein [Hyphomicrobiaceae bacterium]
MSVVLAEHPAEGVVLLRINRPEARNALNLEVRKALVAGLREAAEDPAIRAAVITGNEKAFAAGADIREMRDLGPIELMQRGTHKLWDDIAAFPKPLIAAVNGFALGGGCELALHCDIIIAGEGARFGQPEVKIGILPGASGTQRLVRAVGKYKAMLMVLTGEIVGAREASEMGLVSRVVADGEVVGHATQMAAAIAKLAPVAVELAKEAVLVGQDASLATGLSLERKALWLTFATEDKREGMSAFLEKRAPEFKGK